MGQRRLLLSPLATTLDEVVVIRRCLVTELITRDTTRGFTTMAAVVLGGIANVVLMLIFTLQSDPSNERRQKHFASLVQI